MNLKSALQKNQTSSYESKDGGFSPTCFSIPEGVELYKPKAGVNKLDILPFIKIDGSPAYLMEYHQHIGVGLTSSREICLAKTYGKPCPVCEERARMLADGAKWGDENVKAFSPKRRCLYNVIDQLEPDKGIQVFEVSHFLFEKVLIADAYDEDPEMVFADLQDGRTVCFKGRESEFNGRSSVNKFDSFTFLPRKAGYKDAILDKVVKLDTILTPKTYDQLSALFYGNPEHEEAEALDEPFPGVSEAMQPKLKPKAAPTQECPFGGQWGRDFNLFEQCDECVVRKDCEAAQ